MDIMESNMNFHPDMLKLYFVAGSQDCQHLGNDDSTRSEALLKILHNALSAGITCFQFRDKGKFSLQDNPHAQALLAKDCQKLCKEFGVPFILNDMVDLAFEIGADGIHVGQGDRSVLDIAKEAKRPLILGLSINTLEQACHWDKIAEVDYFGVGPIFPTLSKADHKPEVGLEFPKLLRENNITKPFVAIGGVKATHTPILRQYGADGVAVVSALTQADDVGQAVQGLLVHLS